MTTTVSVPVSVGELIDKITILEIKLEHIADPEKLKNIGAELQLLRAVRRDLGVDSGPAADQIACSERSLKSVNQQIWDAEDEIRGLDRAKDFGEAFVAVARSIYRLNDARAAAKREINLAIGSAIVEEKGYEPY
jgi:hypothetical protein